MYNYGAEVVNMFCNNYTNLQSNPDIIKAYIIVTNNNKTHFSSIHMDFLFFLSFLSSISGDILNMHTTYRLLKNYSTSWDMTKVPLEIN